jgi:fermentation-respiration switch protein FrsA (DUF1100 family)
VNAATIEREMADVDPARAIGRFGGRPLLLLNGENDPTVPRETTDALFAAAREPKRRVTLPGGHIPDVGELMQQTLAFFETNLRNAKNKTAAARPSRRSLTARS